MIAIKALFKNNCTFTKISTTFSSWRISRFSDTLPRASIIIIVSSLIYLEKGKKKSNRCSITEVRNFAVLKYVLNFKRPARDNITVTSKLHHQLLFKYI